MGQILNRGLTSSIFFLKKLDVKRLIKSFSARLSQNLIFFENYVIIVLDKNESEAIGV